MSQPYPSHGQPPPPYAPWPQAAPRNGLGTASLVLGIVGFLFALIPLVGVIAWPMVILGVIFGLVGLNRVKMGAANNRGVAIGGVVMSAAGLLVCILWVAFSGAALATSEARPTTAPRASTSAPAALATAAAAPAAPAPTAAPAAPAGIGDGTHLVGTDIQPGTYKSPGARDSGAFTLCYWTTRAGASSNSDIIDLGTAKVSDQQVVQIGGKVKAFESKGCEGWTKIG